jgi:hypothetical protein
MAAFNGWIAQLQGRAGWSLAELGCGTAGTAAASAAPAAGSGTKRGRCDAAAALTAARSHPCAQTGTSVCGGAPNTHAATAAAAPAGGTRSCTASQPAAAPGHTVSLKLRGAAALAIGWTIYMQWEGLNLTAGLADCTACSSDSYHESSMTHPASAGCCREL